MGSPIAAEMLVTADARTGEAANKKQTGKLLIYM